MALDLQTLLAMYGQRQQQQQYDQYGGMDPLSYTFQRNYDAANQANELRYGDIVGGLTGIYDRNMARINSLGSQERADINRRADQNKQAALSNLTSRGLGGTTVRDSVANKAEEDRNRALRQMQDQETRQRIGADSAMAGDVFRFMERRNDAAPDLNQLASLNQALGASGMYGQYPDATGNIYGGSPVPPGLGAMPSAGGSARYYNPAGPSPPMLSQIGHFGPGSGGAGAPTLPQRGTASAYLAQRQGDARANIGHFGPGSGGMTPSYPLPGGGGTSPLPMPSSLYAQQTAPQYGGYGGAARRTSDPVDQELQRQLLMQLRGGGPRGGRSKPTYRTAGDINNSPFDMNGRVVNKPRNPGFYGSHPAVANSLAATVTVPGSFQGFRGTAPQMPRYQMGVRGYNYTPRGRRRPVQSPGMPLPSLSHSQRQTLTQYGPYVA